jgi:chromosomal replication initiation ATPase DnaA
MKAEEIAERRGVRVNAMLGSGGSKPVFAARRELARYLRGIGKSYPKIGELLGRDHTSVMAMVSDAYRLNKSKACRVATAKRRSSPASSQSEHLGIASDP